MPNIINYQKKTDAGMGGAIGIAVILVVVAIGAYVALQHYFGPHAAVTNATSSSTVTAPDNDASSGTNASGQSSNYLSSY